MRKWGPLGAILVIALVVGGLVVASGGGDDDETASTTSLDGDAVGSGALSFSAAEEQGIEVDWPETCDTETGRLAIPNEFAPECYAPFEGDNGGATDEGVTADTITIAYYQSPPNPISDFLTSGFGVNDTAEDSFATIQGYVDLYNTYAETYGRTVEVVQLIGSGPPNDDVAARADAVRVDEEIGAFMVWGGPILTDAFADELAARGIPCLDCQTGEPEAFADERAPYNLTISSSTDQGRAHLVEWLSKQVAGRPAEFAGEDLQGEERVFGNLYVESDEDAAAQNEETQRLLAEEGIELAESVPYQLDPARLQEQAAAAIARFKEAGVTSIIFAGDPIAPATFTREATAQAYFPEWIITGSALTDTTIAARTYDQAQWAHAFGLTSLSARIDPEVSGPWRLYEWWTGEDPPASGSSGLILPYAQVFFPALQGLGPELTRERWVAALAEGEPTPVAISAPSVNWGTDGPWEGEDWYGVDNWTLIWWDADATGPDEIRQEGEGMYQYVDGGVRYFPGEWPEEDSRAFDPEGAVAFYEEPPEGEAPPDYPSPAG